MVHTINNKDIVMILTAIALIRLQLGYSDLDTLPTPPPIAVGFMALVLIPDLLISHFSHPSLPSYDIWDNVPSPVYLTFADW